LTSHDEFVCRGCGRLIYSFPAGSALWAEYLCGMCHAMPNWHADPRLRARIDPDLEAAQRDAADWQKDQGRRPK
jgi:hypothetical protein